MAYSIQKPNSQVKSLLQEHHLKPQKRLGQNFLVHKGVLAKIVRAAHLSLQDTVLEVGPGLGILTRELANVAKKVIAIEKDSNMVEILQKTLNKLNNVEIIQGDILNTKYKIQDTRYTVVANLPYYITSRVIRKFLEAPCKPKLMILMVQKEVAQRICAKPPRMNVLAVCVQFYAKPEIVAYVKRTSFWPQPNVDSAIVQITPVRSRAGTVPALAEVFFRVVKAGFKQPRKQLGNNLAKGLALPKASVTKWLAANGINPVQRAETLSLKHWIHLAKSVIREA